MHAAGPIPRSTDALYGGNPTAADIAPWVRWVIMAWILLLFFNSAARQLIDDWVLYVDEVTLVIAVTLMVISSITKDVSDRLQWLTTVIIGSAFFFIVATFAFGYDFRLGALKLFYVVFGSFVHLKLFFFAWLFFYLQEKRIFLASHRFFLILLGITLFGFVFNHLLPGVFTSIFTFDIAERYGIQRAKGFHLTNVAGATFVSIMLAYGLFDRSRRINSVAWSYLAIAIPIVAYIFLITTTRSGLVIFALAILVLMVRSLREQIFLWFALVLGLILVSSGTLSAVTEADAVRQASRLIEGLFVSPDYQIPRSAMMYSGTVLAGEYFPFGVGLGMFASPYAENSPIYALLNLQSLYYVRNYNGVIDSNMASIIGELGFLGLVVILFNLLAICRYAAHHGGRWEFIFVTFIFFAILANSIVSPVFFKGEWCVVFAYLLALICRPVVRTKRPMKINRVVASRSR